jgi:hypothetical protein
LSRVAALTLCALTVGCAKTPGGDPNRVVPAEAETVIVVSSLDEVQRRATTFLAGIEGASGALDLLADRFGLDLRSPEGPEALGLDASRGVTVHVRKVGDGEAVVVAASVSDRERFMDKVGTRLQSGAGARPLPGTGDVLRFELASSVVETPPSVPPGAEPTVAAAPQAVAPATTLALGVTSDGVGVLVLARGADAGAVWQAVATTPTGATFAGSPRAAKATATVGATDATGAVVAPLVTFAMGNPLPDAPESLGLARGIVQGIRDSLPAWEGGLSLDADRLVLKVAADHVGEGNLPVSWVRPEGSPEALAKVFPKTTTAFLRLRVDLGKVRKIPSFLREGLLPERLPGLEGAPLPAVSDLIEMVDGDVAVALLGLDPATNLATLGSRRVLRERALSLVHVAIAAKLRDVEMTRRAFAGIASQLGTSGWSVAELEHTPYRGWSFVRDGMHYAVLIDGEVAIFVIGPGEVDSFFAVRDGRATSLASLATPSASPTQGAVGAGTAKEALGQEGQTALGLVIGPLRLARELSARGVPPYFLKIINDVRVVAASVRADEKRLGLSFQVDLR